MKLKDIIAAMQSLESDKMISKEIVISALKEALTKAYVKHVGIDDILVKVDVDEKKGTINVYHQRKVVEEVEDDELEISLKDAIQINSTYKIDDIVDEKINIADFGRSAVTQAKGVLRQKIREAEKQLVFEEYCDKVDDMVMGTVESVEEKFVIVNLGRTLAVMPKGAQIPNEVYKEGQMIKVIISEVSRETKGAQVLVSRADANLVKRLFEKEVPEIFNGIVEIKAIARDAGERTKMAVYSKNENVDPRGSCIGPRGARVQTVIDEIKGEKIDIFEWSEDTTELIKNSLAPAEILGVIDNQERKGLLVVVNDDQLSLAIGKKGKNARLAVKLTGAKIDIKSRSEIEEKGIDWKTLSEEKRAEFLAEQACKKAIAQEEQFRKYDDNVQEDDFISELFDEPVEQVDYFKDEKVEETKVETVKPTKVEVVEEVKVVEESDIEKAAKLAKQKQKETGLDIKAKQEYVSKFEDIAGAAKVEAKSAKPKFKKTNKEEDKEEYKFDPNSVKKDFGLKPIYSDDELEEIKRQEEIEKENAWINDDIDFDEYDEYYDEE